MLIKLHYVLKPIFIEDFTQTFFNKYIRHNSTGSYLLLDLSLHVIPIMLL